MAPVTVMWSFVTDVHAWGPLWSPIRTTFFFKLHTCTVCVYITQGHQLIGDAECLLVSPLVNSHSYVRWQNAFFATDVHAWGPLWSRTQDVKG